MTIFDLESGPDTARARALMPAFEEGEVKVGNIKDEQKIKEKRAERRASYEAAWIDGAALRPETGRVLAIGILPFKAEAPLILHVHQSDEADVIQSFWDFLLTTEASTGRPFAGWSIFHFDLPFLVLRSRMLDVPVPPLLRNGRYFSATRFCDLQDEWLLGRSRAEVKCSLDHVARALGCGAKTGQGKDFADLYSVDETAALDYLRHDLDITGKIAIKLGLM
jgi:hypothetical protein